jgi:hypothetical protein
MSVPKCAACGGDRPMCSLKGQQVICVLARAMNDCTGLANGALRIVERGGKEDEGSLTV